MNCEKTLDGLRKNILENAYPIYQYVSCGPDIYECPFCRAEEKDIDVDDTSDESIMNTIKHYENCIWLWATDSDKFKGFE